MDIYLTATNRNNTIQFPINPERITANTGARVLSFETIALGEIGIPKGSKLARISCDGTFPGAARQALGIVPNWTDPGELVETLGSWRDDGERLTLQITDTPLNLDVYIDTFEHSYAGGHGDVFFRLELVQARPLIVYTVEQQTTARAGISTYDVPQTYTVKVGDSLWIIAKLILQDGGRWREIYDENADIIGSNPDLIVPGQVLRIPGGSGEDA